MPEAQQTTPDAAGVTRTPDGQIEDQNPTFTQPSETEKTTTPSSETPKTETKDEKAAATDKSLLNEKDEEAPGAPKEYEDFKVPDGFALDAEASKEASGLFKSLNLRQSDAQKLVDMFVKYTQAAHEAPFNTYQEKRQEWRNEINADPEIGGSKLRNVKVSIGKLIDSFGNAKVAEAFRDAMDFTGAGDNPAVVRGLYALSKKLTEGGPVRGGGPSPLGQAEPGGGRPSAAQALYPNLPSTSR